MPEDINHKCLLNAVRTNFFITAHHPGVVYEHIEVLELLLNLRGQSENGFLDGKVEKDVFDRTIRAGPGPHDVLHCPFIILFVSAGYYQAVAISIESSCRFQANT